VTWDSHRFIIYDISNPYSPTETFNSGALAGNPYPYSVAVAGSYAYIVSNTGNTLTIYDVSNPRGAFLVSTTAITGEPIDIAVSGKYAYITHQAGVDGVEIYDISNAASPSLAGSVATTASPSVIRLQGRYAYIISAAAQNKVEVIDVKDPATPAVVGSITLVEGATEFAVQGRYGYTASTNYIQVIDLSTPATPISVGTFGTAGGDGGLEVQGRHLIQINNSTVMLWDIGGAYIQGLETGSLEAANIDVRSHLTVNNGLEVRGSIGVGKGGLSSAGTLAISASNSNAVTIAPFNTAAGNTGELRFMELAANGSNYAGFKAPDSIASNLIYILPTTAPTAGQVLSASAVNNASSTLSWTTSGASQWTTSGSDIHFATGLVSVGTTTLTTTLSVDGSYSQPARSIAVTGATMNNVNIGSASTIELTGSAGNFSITGIEGGTNGRMITLYFTDNSNSNMTICDVAGCGNNSAAANQILTLTGADALTTGLGSATLIYSTAAQKWVLVNFVP